MADRKAFLLRMDPVLSDALSRWADDEMRSVNGQIEFLLKQALARAGRLPGRRAADADRDKKGRR